MNPKLFVKHLGITFLFVVYIHVLHAQVSGRVYRDYNNSGTFTTSGPNEYGVPSTTVKAYNATNVLLATATTSSNGTYTFSTAQIPSGTAVRIEFSDFPANTYVGPSGSASNTTVQFATAGSSANNINLGINAPKDFCNSSENPMLVTPSQIFGNANGSTNIAGTSQNYTGDASLIGFNYDATGKNNKATVSQTGTTYGLAYSKPFQSVFSAAYVKRHSGLKNGTGAIYRTTNAGVTSLFLDLNVVFGANWAGADPHPVGAGNTDDGNAGSWFRDSGTFDKVGKTGLGDLDVSENGDTLYTINLFTRQLVVIPIRDASGALMTPTAAQITLFNIPAPSTCTTDYRPFGLGVHNGKVMIGMICSGESTRTGALPQGDKTKLKAYLYEYNPANNTLNSTAKLDFQLDFPRGCQEQASSYQPFTSTPCPTEWLSDWLPWRSTMATDPIKSDIGIQPQPMLVDIDFDGEDIILGFRDRYGDQMGDEAGHANTSISGTFSATTTGDILRASSANGVTWTLENNGTAGGRTASGYPRTEFNNVKGSPTLGKEFYWQDYYSFSGLNGAPHHDETSMGGLVQVPGKPSVVFNCFDETLPGDVYVGGARWLSNTNGSYQSALNLYQRTSRRNFGKANGLGDIEAICSSPDIEIGNRVWEDTDGDGLQDAGENGIAGVTVKLYKKNGASFTAAGSAVTASNGTYYFKGLMENTDYEVRIENYTSAGIPSGYIPSTSNADAKISNVEQEDWRDADQIVTGQNLAIPYKTGFAGQNNHTLDFAFIACPTKPDAGLDQSLCFPNQTIDLINAASGEAWSVVSSPVGASANINPSSGLVSGMTAQGIYTLKLTITSTGCFDEISVTRVKPNAGTDKKVCAPNTTVSLGAAPANHTWALDSANSIGTATVNASTGAVTGLSAIGNYYFILTNTTLGCKDTVLVARYSKPNAGINLSICDPKTSVQLNAATAGQTWTVLSSPWLTSPTINAAGLAQNITTAGAYLFLLNNGNCTDTITVTKAARPSAGADINICNPTTVANVGYPPFGTTWTTDNTFNPVIPTFNTTTGAISGLTTNGTYRFILTNTAGCSDTVLVNRSPRPNGGANISFCGSAATTADLADALVGETWSVLSRPWPNTTAAINATTGAVSNLNNPGTYQFLLTNTGGCKDTVSIIKGAQPVAAADFSICEPTNLLYFQLPAPAYGSVYTAAASNPAVIDLTYYWYVTGLKNNGIYKIYLTETASGCQDSLLVTRNAGPSAGSDQYLCSTQTTTQLKTPGANETWACQTCGAGTTVNASTGVVSGMVSWTDNIFRLTNSVTGCFDDVNVYHNWTTVISAGADFAICQPATIANLPKAPGTGQTWTFVSGPATPTISQNAAAASVSGLTANGAYTFRLSSTGSCTAADDIIVTRNAQPVAQAADVQICNAATSVDLSPDYVAPIYWYAGADNPSVASINVFTGAVTGMTNDGIYQFHYKNSVTLCADTIFVKKATKPTAGTDVFICAPLSIYDLPNAPAGQTWNKVTGNTATINSTTGLVTNMSTAGDYFFYLDNIGCSDTVKVTKSARPNAGVDLPAICLDAVNINLPDAATNEQWTAFSTNPATVTIANPSGLITNYTKEGRYNFILQNTVTMCADTMQIEIYPIPSANASSLTDCENSAGTGMATFNLNSLNTTVGGLNTVTWFEDAALTISIPTPSAYNSISKTVYAKVQDVNCTNSAPIVLTASPRPVIMPIMATCSGITNGSGTITVSASIAGGGILEYSLDGGPFQSSTIFTDVTDGAHSVEVQLQGSTCSSLANVTLACACTNPTLIVSDPAEVCFPTTVDITTASVITSNTGITTTYWQDAATTIPLDATTGTATAIKKQGTYYVKSVASNTGCFSIRPISVVINSKPVIADATAKSCSSDAVNLGTLVSDYASLYNPIWKQGSVTGAAVADPANVVPSGNTTYFLIAENASGCKDTAQVQINVDAKPSITSVTQTCIGADAQLTINATVTSGTLEYALFGTLFNTTNVVTIANAVAGNTASLLVATQGTSCVVNTIYTLQSCATCTVDAGSNVTICEGLSTTLTATATGTAPFTYSWDNGLGAGASKTASPTVTTTYNVTMTDNTGCTKTDAITVTVNPKPSFELESTNITCNGANNGTITIKNVVGISPFEYSINDGVSYDTAVPSTTKIYNGLTPDTYKPTVRDANGCVKKCQ